MAAAVEIHNKKTMWPSTSRQRQYQQKRKCLCGCFACRNMKIFHIHFFYYIMRVEMKAEQI